MTSAPQELSPLPPDALRYADGYTSRSGVRVAYERDWPRSHALEEDGLCPLLYQYMHQSSKGRERALTSLRLPETVVFDHNFPRAWYAYDPENKEIIKRPGKMLDAQTMFDVFSAAYGGCDVVAQFIYVSVDVEEEWRDVMTSRERRRGTLAGQKLTYVEFFTRDSLHDFLFRQQRKPDGVLQKFVVPKGEGSSRHNFQFHVIWSPLVTTVYRRTNRHRLDDGSVSLAARASTYDGPPFYSEETLVTDETKQQLRRLCGDLAEHFYRMERKRITRLSLYFRSDDENRMWVLWCGSLRVGADSLNPSTLRVPTMLHMRTEVLNDGHTRVARHRARRDAQKLLLLLDTELFKVTGDLSFALNVNASNARQAKDLDTAAARDAREKRARELARQRQQQQQQQEQEQEEKNEAGSDGGGRQPWNDPSHPLYPSYRCVFADEAEAAAAAAAAGCGLGQSGGGGGHSGATSPARSLADRAPSSSAAGTEGSPGDAGEEPAARAVRRELTALAMDAWYATYSTALSDMPRAMPTARVALAEPLVAALAADELRRLTDLLGLVPLDASTAAGAARAEEEAGEGTPPGASGHSAFGGEMTYYVVAADAVAPGRRLDRPSAEVEGDVIEFFAELFAARGAEVRDVCLERYAAYFDEAMYYD